MSVAETQSSLCKSVCWLIGAVIGAYLAYAMVKDMARAPVVSAVVGIVAMLVIGLILRRLFCRKRSASAAAGDLPASSKPVADASLAAASTRFASPDEDALDQALEARVNQAAAAILEETSAKDAPEASAQEPEPEQAAPEGATSGESTPENAAKAPAQTPETQPAAENTGAENVTAENVTADAVPLRPKPMEAPEAGQGDDLRQIDGLGDTEISALNAAGIYRFEQFVAMNRRELAWIDQNIATGDAVAKNWRKHAIALVRQRDDGAKTPQE